MASTNAEITGLAGSLTPEDILNDYRVAWRSRQVSLLARGEVMLGRAMFGNPWVFAGRKPEDTQLPEKLSALVELARGFEKISPPKNFAILKKHIKAFVTGFDGAADLRAKLMQAENADEIEKIALDTVKILA